MSPLWQNIPRGARRAVVDAARRELRAELEKAERAVPYSFRNFNAELANLRDAVAALDTHLEELADG